MNTNQKKAAVKKTNDSHHKMDHATRGPQVSQTELDKERAESEGMGTAIHPHMPAEERRQDE